MKKLKSMFVGEDGVIPESICAAVGILGIVLLGFGVVTVWGTGWGKDLFIPGATLVTVALTAWVASKAVVEWTEQRERDRQTAEYKHREEVYEQLATFMLARIAETGKPYDKGVDADLRTKAAMWGSAATITALGDWQALLGKVIDAHNGAPKFQATPDETEQLEDAFGRAVAAMRSDLSSSDKNTITRHEILKSIFNR